MISHDHKTIFIHIPKCAGQSVEKLFLGDLSLSWQQRQHLGLRPNADPNQGPERLAHLFAKEYVTHRHVSAQKYKDYFSFAIVRDPLDRLLSELNFRKARKKAWSTLNTGFEGLEHYVTWAARHGEYSDRYRHICPQVAYLRNSRAEIIVDQILKFETLPNSFGPLAMRIFGQPKSLPNCNKTQRKIWTRQDLSQSDLHFVRDYYREDYALLSYPEIGA